MRKLELKNFDQKRLGFQPHGIYFSNSTQRLYVISHTAQRSGTVVEIFKVVDEPELHLRHLRQVQRAAVGVPVAWYLYWWVERGGDPNEDNGGFGGEDARQGV